MTRLAIMLLGMGVLFFFKKKKKKPEASSVAVVQPLPISPIALSKSDTLASDATSSSAVVMSPLEYMSLCET